jgi:hypothetical protein
LRRQKRQTEAERGTHHACQPSRELP